MTTTRRHQYAIFGGEDHKTGQADETELRFQRLADLFAAYVPVGDVKDCWSGQVVETNDGLPLIGEIAERQFVSTGYAGNGMTFGTLGAMMACDQVIGRSNPWRPLFDVSRKNVLGGAWDYVKENLDYPYYMIKDRIVAAEAKSIDALKRREGAVLTVGGQRVAAYRDAPARSERFRRSARTWAALCTGMRPNRPGTALATARDSNRAERSSRDRPKRHWSRCRSMRPNEHDPRRNRFERRRASEGKCRRLPADIIAKS